VSRVTADDVRRLAAGGESHTVEFKVDGENQQGLGELLASFANSDGGTLLIGVDDECNVVGVRELYAVENKLRAATKFCTPSLDRFVDIYTVDVGGRIVLVAEVPARNDAVYSYNSIFRWRRGAGNVAIPHDDLVMMLNRRSQNNFDQQAASGLRVVDLDVRAINNLIYHRNLVALSRGQQLNLQPYPSASALSFLTTETVLLEVNGELVPSIGGVLVLGSQPQAVVPDAIVQCVRHRGTRVGVDFLDRRVVFGTLPQQLDQVISFIERNSALFTSIVGLKRADLPQFPLSAVREAVMNALMHRSYALSGAVINVTIFADRVEVISPGGLLPGVSINTPGSHRSRNQVAANLLMWLGVVEKFGFGLDMMRQAMEEARLPAPEFNMGDDLFKVTLYGHTRESASTLVREGQKDYLPPATIPAAWSGLDYKQIDFLSMLARAGEGSISIAAYKERYGVKDAQANRDLTEMMERGLLRREGQARATRYIYINPDSQHSQEG